MKRTNLTIAAIATSLGMVAGSAAFAADVTLRIGEPGFHGRLEIGEGPKPVLVTPSPVIIEREHAIQEPTYVYVPSTEQRDWANHCRAYDACNRPVYFVEDHWYNDVYVPQYKSRHQIHEEARQDVRDARHDAREAKQDAKEAQRDYKDAKRDARDRN